MPRNRKQFICFLCEKRYHELEQAEVCERGHAKTEHTREKHDDDGQEYGDPRDFRAGRE